METSRPAWRRLAEVIHRDHYTRVHVVPSHGADLSEASAADLVRLENFLSAFGEAYETVVVEFALLDIERLPAILDEETAVIVAGNPQTDELTGDVAAALRALGIDDVIFMPTARRGVAGARDRA